MTQKEAFVQYLEKLKDNRGALAALRRGLKTEPGTAIEQYPYISPWASKENDVWRENVYYIIAALYASHPKSSDVGDIGASFFTMKKKKDSDSLDKRFVSLLNSHPDDVNYHLRQAISLAKSMEVAINWNQLFKDMMAWNHPEKYVQRNWAKSYYGRQKEESIDERNDEEKEKEE